jgi:hypothetical protein
VAGAKDSRTVPQLETRAYWGLPHSGEPLSFSAHIS